MAQRFEEAIVAASEAISEHRKSLEALQSIKQTLESIAKIASGELAGEKECRSALARIATLPEQYKIISESSFKEVQLLLKLDLAQILSDLQTSRVNYFPENNPDALRGYN